MSFLTPAWLLLLIPWTGLVLWLLSGQRQRVAVPFLELWSGPAGGPKIKRTIQPPPAALACVLAGMLLAILAAGGPVVRIGAARTPITLIVDRGITMSANGQREQAADALSALTPDRVMLIPSWPGLAEDGSNWRQAPRSPLPTDAWLRASVSEALAVSNNPVVVLSDQQLGIENPRLLQIAPTSIPQNVSIVRFAVAESPRLQAMLRLRNQSRNDRAEVQIRTAEQTHSRMIDLPRFDGETNVFIDLPTIGDTIEARLVLEDALPIDNMAWLVRQRAWPKIEVRGELPAELMHMTEIYGKFRPAGERSPRVVVTDSLFSLPPNEPAVACLPEGSTAQAIRGRIGIEYGNHPVIAGIDWPAVAEDAHAAQGPGEGWMTLVRNGPLVLVAVRERPVRQVWVGFRSPTFVRRSDYVIFWSNVFSWLGEGGETIAGQPVEALDADWTLQTAPESGYDLFPGIYQHRDGRLRALNALDVRFNPPPNADRWRLGRLQRASSGTDLRPVLLVLGMGFVLAATALWKRQAPSGAPRW